MSGRQMLTDMLIFILPRGKRRRVVKWLLVLAACAVTGATTAIGCGWFGPTDSVRFAGNDPERAYSRLPRLSMNTADVVDELEDDETYVASDYVQRLVKVQDARWQKATTPTAAREELEQSHRALQDYLEDDKSAYWSELPLSPQQRRNTAIDLLDALAALDSGTPAEAIQSYVKARQAYDSWLGLADRHTRFVSYGQPKPAPLSDEEKTKLANDVRRALAEMPPDKNLADNRAYLEAATFYQESKLSDAARAFDALAARYPRSEKREAALLMAGLAHLKQSASYKVGDASGVSSAPCVGCRDVAWRAARASFARLLREYPRGRYSVEARGWTAFLSLRVGAFDAALADYYRLLADESHPAGRAEALKSLGMSRAHADEASLRRLEADLSNEPAVALIYAYHNIYNYALDLNIYEYPFVESEDESTTNEQQTYVSGPNWTEYEREQRQERKVETARRRELQRIAEFAAASMRRYPRAKVSGDFALRVAEAKLELGENGAAHQFARRALALGVREERRIEALWIKGVAEYRQREYDAARRTLASLISEQPRGRLTKNARTMLAILAEDAGDTDAALEQYFALDYREDIAYFIDVLLTPEQLAGFIERHSQSAHLDELNYALGLRYLRDGRYAEARAAYARIRTAREGDYRWDYGYATGCAEDERNRSDPRCGSPKDAGYDTENGIHKRWVLRDLKTAEALEQFERDIAAAEGDEAQAEALYQMASYLYESDLLFYNPAAWRGARYMNLAALDQSHAYRAPNEAQRLWEYMQAHDMAARALALYLEVVRRYPQSRAARDALYTAAVCHERLASYNDYWRNAYSSGLHAGARMVTYKDVRATYPNYQLPRATLGWEPSTRTVNGGPGWAAPPQPQPRPTRFSRVRLKAEQVWQRIVAAWNAWGRRQLTLLLLLASALFVGRFASRVRRQLREQLAARRPLIAEPPPTLAPWLMAETIQLNWRCEARDQIKRSVRQLLRRVCRGFEPLLHDAPGRTLLALGALAHGVLTALLTMLAWTWYAS